MTGMIPNLMISEHQKKAFYHALRTKGFVILAGLSGTGKTKIFEKFEIIPKITINNISIRNKIIKDILKIKEWLTSEKLEDWNHICSLIRTKGYRNKNDELSQKTKDLLGLLASHQDNDSDLTVLYRYKKGKNENVWQKKDNLDVNNPNLVDITVEDAQDILNNIVSEIKKIGTPDEDSIKKEFFADRFLEFIKFIIKSAKIENIDHEAWRHLYEELCKFIDTGEKNANHSDEKNYYRSQSNELSVFHKFIKSLLHTYTKKLFFPIRPNFNDSKSLLGFYNPLEKQYQSTELLDFILEAQKEYEDWFQLKSTSQPQQTTDEHTHQAQQNISHGQFPTLYFVLFDEMNLSRVEYYFADFLSVLESNRDEKGYTRPILLHKAGNNVKDATGNKVIPQELRLPPNLYFVGTVNIDETTHMFSPKVLDRAFIIEFDADIAEYVQFLESQNQQSGQQQTQKQVPTLVFSLEDFTRNSEFAKIDKEKITEFIRNNQTNSDIICSDKLTEINKILKSYGLHFGYRVFDEIIMFLCNADNSEYKLDLKIAFDLAIKMKILPKFHGTRQKLEKPIMSLIGMFDDKNANGNKIMFSNGKLILVNKNNNSIDIKLNQIPTITNDKLNIENTEYTTDYPYTVHKLFEMLYKLQTIGVASFL